MDTTWQQVMRVIGGVSVIVFGFMILQRLLYAWH